MGIWGDLYLVAPCTAATLSAFVNGTCSNLLQAVFLSSRCPVALAPAMDLDMYTNKATQDNLKTLSERGVQIIDPKSGALASGLEGKGRMEEPEEIANFVETHFTKKMPFAGKRILVTAGPTEEAIDAVRFLGNRSTGKMGFEIAGRLADLGAEVTLITGPVNLDTPPRVTRRIDIVTAQELYDKTVDIWPKMNAAIACAAVADMRPSSPSTKKLHKGDLPDSMTLENTPDTLLELGNMKTQGQLLVGFALESDTVEESLKSAEGKLKRKNLDMIVMNTLSDDGAGFSHDTNKVTILQNLDGHNTTHVFELKSKREVAKDIVNLLTF
jgi:phosphopantothenoylcysteine decarboxylase/phosphopantothenate--cysteine ligase